jgi:rhodanese-related sulfurtransferase
MKNILTILLASFVLQSCVAQKGNNLTATEFSEAIKDTKIQLLDVRTKEEYAQGHIAKALQANWNDNAEFEKRTASLDIKKTVCIYCLSGGRSAAAASSLRIKGFTVVELKGGITAWKNASLPTEGNATKEKGMELTAFATMLKTNDLVLVDFGAKWCPPCIKMNPILDSLQKQMPSLKLVKIDLDKDVEICKANNITELPVFHFYKKGILLKEVKGEMKIEEMISILK